MSSLLEKVEERLVQTVPSRSIKLQFGVIFELNSLATEALMHYHVFWVEGRKLYCGLHTTHCTSKFKDSWIFGFLLPKEA